jgi:hypothetical protein
MNDMETNPQPYLYSPSKDIYAAIHDAVDIYLTISDGKVYYDGDEVTMTDLAALGPDNIQVITDAITDQLHGPDEAPASNTNDGDGEEVSAGASGASGGHEATNDDVLPDTPTENAGGGDSRDQGATATDQSTTILISVSEGSSKGKTSPTALPPTVRAIDSDSAPPTTGPPTSKGRPSSKTTSNKYYHYNVIAIGCGAVVIVLVVAVARNMNRKLERAKEEDTRGCSRKRKGGDIESMCFAVCTVP